MTRTCLELGTQSTAVNLNLLCLERMHSPRHLTPALLESVFAFLRMKVLGTPIGLGSTATARALAQAVSVAWPAALSSGCGAQSLPQLSHTATSHDGPPAPIPT